MLPPTYLPTYLGVQWSLSTYRLLLNSFRLLGSFTHKLIAQLLGREPWSSAYGRRLMIRRSWVQILAPYTGWTLICCKIYKDVCLKRPKINDKRGRGWPIFLLWPQTPPCQSSPWLLDEGKKNLSMKHENVSAGVHTDLSSFVSDRSVYLRSFFFDIFCFSLSFHLSTLKWFVYLCQCD